MDLFQTIAAGVIVVLAVVAGASLAALWHSSRQSHGREEQHRGPRREKERRRGPEMQTVARRGSLVPGASSAPGRQQTAPTGGSRTAEVERLKRDRPTIQAAIIKGDAKALYQLASEYQRLGFEHAAHELFEKAKWIDSSGQRAEQAGSSQERGGATKAQSSPGVPEERRPR